MTFFSQHDEPGIKFVEAFVELRADAEPGRVGLRVGAAGNAVGRRRRPGDVQGKGRTDAGRSRECRSFPELESRLQVSPYLCVIRQWS